MTHCLHVVECFLATSLLVLLVPDPDGCVVLLCPGFWLLWTVLILFSCCCAYRHRRAKLRVQQQQRQREISLLAYHGAASFPSSMLDLSKTPVRLHTFLWTSSCVAKTSIRSSVSRFSGVSEAAVLRGGGGSALHPSSALQLRVHRPPLPAAPPCVRPTPAHAARPAAAPQTQRWSLLLQL